jgi:FkbM family methyltransferase
VARRVEGTPLEGPLRRLAPLVDNRVGRRNRLEHHRLRLLLAWLLAEDDMCIDIGANRGAVLAEFVELAPHGRHLAFEPVPPLAQALAARFRSVDVREMALSDRTGELEFTHFPTFDGISRLGDVPELHGHVGQRMRVAVGRLDDVLPADAVPRVIKVDAEGEDRAVIAGAIRVIETHRPTVIFEHTAAGGAGDTGESSALVDLLHNRAGLRIFDLDGNGPYDSQSLARAHQSKRVFNFVAHP